MQCVSLIRKIHIMKLSIVLPAKDEEELLENTVTSIRKYTSKIKLQSEIIIVENGSSDRTLEIASRLGRKYKNVRVEYLPYSSYGEAILKGIQSSKSEFVAVFNVDFWNKKFINLVKKDLLGNDIVSGSKNLSTSKDKRPFLRKVVTKLFNFYIKIVFEYKGTDTHGVKVFKRSKALSVLKTCKANSGIFDTELMIKSQRAGLKILELPVNVVERRKTRFGLKRLLDTPKDILELSLVLKGEKNKKLEQKLSTRGTIAFFVLFTVVLVLYHSASKMNFHWIDDGFVLQNSQNILNSLKRGDVSQVADILVEENIGRFRPVYWMWKSMVTTLAGNNAAIHYLFRFLLIGGTSTLIILIIHFISGSYFASLIGGILFLIHPLNSENWYRLGPQEPLMVFLITLTIFLLLKRKALVLSILLLFGAFLSKETAIALVPAVFVYFLLNLLISKKNDKYLIKYIFYSIFFLTLSLMVTFSIRAGYSEFYEFNYQNTLLRLKSYFNLVIETTPYLLILVSIFAFRLFKTLCKGGKKQERDLFVNTCLFFLIFILFLIVQSPWAYVLRRYTLPSVAGMVIFYGLQINHILSWLSKKSNLLRFVSYVIVVLLLFNYMFANLLKTYNFGQRVAFSTQNVQEMMKMIAANVPRNSKVFLNLEKSGGTYEHFRETTRQLDTLYGRGDIKLEYLELRDSSNKNYFVASGDSFSNNYVDEQSLLSDPKLEKISQSNYQGKELVLTTPVNIIKQVIKKTANFIKGDKLTLDGIVTFYVREGDWSLYSSI